MRTRPAWIAVWLLLVLAAARMLGVSLHTPVAGYANQYDMVRSAACLGLWPTRDPAQRALATPDAPRAQQVLGERQPEGCYPSTDVALAALGIGVARGLHALGVGEAPWIDLRIIGTSKAVLLLAFAVLITLALRAYPRIALAHALFVAAVLADPFNTLFLNTLYTETGALFGAWLALAGLLLRAMPQTRHGAAFALAAFGCALLGASRVQHLILPFGIVLLWGLLAHASARRRDPVPNRLTAPAPALVRGAGAARLQLAALLAIACAAVALQLSTQERFAHVAQANRQDMLFGAVLPAAADPIALAVQLDLPPACAELAYTNWYRTLGHDINSECPQAGQPGLARIALLLAREPATAGVLFGRGLVQASAWRISYLGELAGASHARLDPGPLGLFASLADAAAPSSLRAQAVFWLLPLLAGIGASVRLLRRQPRESIAIASDTLIAACAGIIAAVWASSILGDGYSELARHLHLAVSALLAGWLLQVLALWRWPARAAAESLLLVALALAICWSQGSAPLAVGRSDLPATDAMLAGRQHVSGWVLAPNGATRIEIRSGAQVLATLDPVPAADLAQYFPLDGRTAAFRFDGAIEFGPTALARTLGFHLIDAAGREQLFDRRRLVLLASPAAP